MNYEIGKPIFSAVEIMHLVQDGSGITVGFIRKSRPTKSERHPWQAFTYVHPFVGEYPTDSTNVEAGTFYGGSGKHAAVAAIIGED